MHLGMMPKKGNSVAEKFRHASKQMKEKYRGTGTSVLSGRPTLFLPFESLMHGGIDLQSVRRGIPYLA